MKKFVKIFVPVAVAAIALVSCTKEVKAPVYTESGTTIRVSVDFTKTYIGTNQGVPNSIMWGTGEYMKLLVSSADTTVIANSLATSADAWNGTKQALFEFNINPKAGASYLYQGIYPASVAVPNDNKNPAKFKVDLPASQNATASSYDPAAYILVAQPQSFTSVETDWMAAFRRVTALNKVTLTGLSADIESVEFIAPDPVKLAGRRFFNLSTGADSTVYLGGNSIKVKYATALSGSSKVVWFTSWGASILEGENLTIVAKSATHTYTRTITAKAGGIQFKQGWLNTLSVDMSSANEEAIVDLSGNYLIAGIKTGNWSLMDSSNPGKFFNEFVTDIAANAATVDFETFESITDIDDYAWTLEAVDGGYTIKNSYNDVYLALTNDGNEAYTATDVDNTDNTTLFSVTYDASTKIAVINSVAYGERNLNYNSGNTRFAFYKPSSNMGAVYLISAVPDPRTKVTLSFATTEVELTTATAGSYSGQSVSATPSAAAVLNAVEYSWDADAAFGSIDEDSGSISLLGVAGSATVTATFAGDTDYRPATASYTVSVIDASVPAYVKVTSAPSDWSGEYLMVCEAENKALSEISTTSTKYGIGAAVTIDHGRIESNSTTDAYKLVIAKASSGSAYTIKLGSDYLFWSSGNSLANTDSETDNSRWTIAAGATAGNWVLTNVAQDTRVIWYNTSSPRFACYEGKAETTTGYAPIQLYQLEDNRLSLDTPQNLSLSGKTLSWTAVSGAATYDVKVGSVSASVNTNSYTFTGADGYYNVSVVAVSGDGSHKNSEAATLSDACFGTPVLASPVLSAGLLNETSVQATWAVDPNATAGYHAVIKIKGNDAEISSQDVNVGSVTFSGLSDNTNYTVYVYAIAVTGSKPYGQSATSSIDLATQASATIANVIEGGGSGTFTIANVTVLAVPATNTAIIGDGTGNVLFFKASHGLVAGDVITVSGATTLYNGVVEFTNTPTATKTGSTTVNHGTPASATAEFLAPLAAASSSVVYVSGIGKQQGQNISVNGYTFHLPVANAATDGKNVAFTGYIYGWSSSYNNFNFFAISLTEDPNAPALSVSPASKNWAYNETDQATFTVSATNCTWDYSPTSLSWATIVKEGNTLKVTPTGANGGNDDLTGTIVISGTPNGVGYTVEPVSINLKQVKSGGSTAQPELVYTLNGSTTGGSNGYATESDITQSSISWKVTGNTTIAPWRIGGKGAVVRPVYSTTAIAADITSIAIEHGSSTCTVNSLKVTVHNSAADAASGLNAIATFNYTTNIASKTITVNKTDNTSWAGKYYRLEYDLTCATGSNQYLQLKSIKFTGIK